MTKRRSVLSLVCILLTLFSFGLETVHATDPDFSIFVIPDTQYMLQSCSPQVLNVLMNWIVANRAASQGGVFTTNLKAVIGLGDVTQQSSAGEFSRAAGSTTSGYGILDFNSITMAAVPPGNHDYINPTTDHTVITSGFTNPSGFFSATYRAAHGYFGSIGGLDTAALGGSFDDVNYFTILHIGSRNILIYSLEYQPRSAVLVWAKTIHDANPGFENIVVTHSFQTHAVGKLSTYSGEPGNNGTWNDNGGFGLKTSQAVSGTNGAGDTFNSGYGMWNSFLNAWGRLTMVLNGHWIPVETHYLDTPNTYFYQTNSLTSASSNAQTVQAIYTDWQDLETESGSTGSPPSVVGGEYPAWYNAGTAPQTVSQYCTANNWTPYRLAHLMILQFRPSAGTVEGYIVATTSGKWEPTFGGTGTGAPSNTPVLLFSLPYTGVASAGIATKGPTVVTGPTKR